MAEIELAYSISTWNAEEIVQALAEVSGAGWEAIELSSEIVSLFEDRPAVFTEMLATEKLRLAAVEGSMTGISPESFEEETDGHLRMVRFLGVLEAPVAVLRAPPRPEDLPPAVAWSLLGEFLNQLGQAAQELDVTVCLLPGIGTLVETRQETERLLAQTSSRLVRICMDTAHLASMGLSSVTFYRKHRRRIGHVHVRDVRTPRASRRRKTSSGGERRLELPAAELGHGIAPLRELFRALAEDGYEGWVTIKSRTGTAAPGAAASDRRRLGRLLERA